MTSIIRTRQDKARAIDVIQTMMEQFLLHAVDPPTATAIGQYLAWMRKQTTDLNVNAKLETDGPMMRVTLEFAFVPMAPMVKR